MIFKIYNFLRHNFIACQHFFLTFLTSLTLGAPPPEAHPIENPVGYRLVVF
jgi:hypothetical protein